MTQSGEGFVARRRQVLASWVCVFDSQRTYGFIALADMLCCGDLLTSAINEPRFFGLTVSFPACKHILDARCRAAY